MQKKIIIIGAGQVGLNTAHRLFNAKEDCLITLIEQDAHTASELDESNEFTVVHGSGTCPNILQSVGIYDAHMLFAVTDSDEVNLLACFIADKLCEDRDKTKSKRSLLKYARVRNEYLQNMITDVIPIDVLINPEQICAEKMVELIRYSQLVDSLPFEDGKLKLYGIKLPTNSPLIGQSLREYTASAHLTIVAIRTVGFSEIHIPKADHILKTDDEVYLCCTAIGLHNIYKNLVPEPVGVPHVYIAGASRVGIFLAQELTKQNFQVTWFDPDAELMQDYSEADWTANVTCLVGSLTDQEFLISEKIAQADTLITCSNDNEENLVCAIISERLGCDRVLVVNDRPEYASIIRSLGFEAVLSPRQVAVNELTQRVINTLSLASHTLSGSEDVEIREFQVKEDSRCVDAPIHTLGDFKWPVGKALIASILRKNKTIMPSGDTIIKADDLLFIIAKSEYFEAIETLFEPYKSWRFW
jgi:trk system potassium uptake protein